jgi:hypothetical protein
MTSLPAQVIAIRWRSWEPTLNGPLFLSMSSISPLYQMRPSLLWHNYGLVIGRKDSQECSLPEHITPHAFADATRFGFTDYEKEGIPVEYEALLRLLPLEFPDGRVKVVNQ